LMRVRKTSSSAMIYNRTTLHGKLLPSWRLSTSTGYSSWTGPAYLWA